MRAAFMTGENGWSAVGKAPAMPSWAARPMMCGLPQDLPINERSAVRLVVRDVHQRVLLFHTHDPDYPDLGTWWELPGGGIDPGETYLDTALRELREETGIPLVVRLDGIGPAVDESHRLDYEREDYFGFRWWPVADVVGSRQRFYPGRLPELLNAFLAGERIDEPFDYGPSTTARVRYVDSG